MIILSLIQNGTTTLEEFSGSLSSTKMRSTAKEGGVALNRMVGGRPLPRHEAEGQAVGRGSGALPGNREVTRANLNVPQPSLPSARATEVDSSSEDEFQDSNTEPVPRSLAQSITATRVPQVAQQTSQPPSPTRIRQIVQCTESVESVQTPGSHGICGEV